jgi:hypothetical protein
MNSFVIQGARAASSLEFFERTPVDPHRPIERFKVRLTDQDLSAVGRIYMGSTDAPPAEVFARMAATWQGWQDPFTWVSQDGELTLSCTQDRNGHVCIRAEVRSGPGDADWTVATMVQAEAGQLEELARRAALFFGRSGIPAPALTPA